MVGNPTLIRPSSESIAAAREQYRLQMVAEEEATVQRLLGAYMRMIQPGSPIGLAMQAAVDRITRDEPSANDTRNLDEYQRFLSTVRQDMDGFSAIYSNEAANLSEHAAGIADNAALAMTQANVPTASAEIALAWNQPNAQALADLVSIVDNEVWRGKQAAYGQNVANLMSDTILSMVAQGKHSSVTAQVLTDAFDIPFSWADNTVRTAQIYSYRRTSHLSYASNADIVDGWVWQAALDRRTCLSCVSKHGQSFKVDQSLNDHHRGRCTPLPKVKGTRWHEEMTTGEQWFFNLTPGEHQAYRKHIRNNALYDAVLSREVAFDRLSVPYEDDVYGEMLRQTTYREAIRQ